MLEKKEERKKKKKTKKQKQKQARIVIYKFVLFYPKKRKKEKNKKSIKSNERRQRRRIKRRRRRIKKTFLTMIVRSVCESNPFSFRGETKREEDRRRDSLSVRVFRIVAFAIHFDFGSVSRPENEPFVS